MFAQALARRRAHVQLQGALAEVGRLRDLLARELSQSPVLQKVYAMRDELTALWGRSMATREQLVQQLQDWCQRAEASGIAPLAAFSQRLRSYV